MEVVGGAVENNRTADHIGRAKPVRIDCADGNTVGRSENGWQVSGVERMLDVMRVIMPSGRREGDVSSSGTYSIFVDVKPKKLRRGKTDCPDYRQSAAPIGGEENLAIDLGMGGITVQQGPSYWWGKRKVLVFHVRTSFPIFMHQ